MGFFNHRYFFQFCVFMLSGTIYVCVTGLDLFKQHFYGDKVKECSTGDTVNQLLFAVTLFHDSLPINWFTMCNVCHQALIQTCVIITNIHGLLNCEKYSPLRGFCLPCENFSQTNKSWFDVVYKKSLSFSSFFCFFHSLWSFSYFQSFTVYIYKNVIINEWTWYLFQYYPFPAVLYPLNMAYDIVYGEPDVSGKIHVIYLTKSFMSSVILIAWHTNMYIWWILKGSF